MFHPAHDTLTSRVILLSPEITYSSRTRVLSYFLPSMLGSLALNIPKFLEAKLDTLTFTDTGTNDTSEMVIYNVTSLRLDPDYMYYYIHWTRSAPLHITYTGTGHINGGLWSLLKK